MEEFIKKANKALLEGDREEVLHLLNNKQATVQVMWLRAQAIKEDGQRLALLRQVSASGHPTYSPLAKNILDRERQFENELNRPAEYKFWTRQPWLGRLNSLKKHRLSFIGGSVLLLVLIAGASIALSLAGQSQAGALALSQTKTAAAQQAAQATPKPTPSITPLPVNAQVSISYPSGKLTILSIEAPTNRRVMLGTYGGDQPAATPAVGSQFVAIQLEFQCLKALCENPPEAELKLQLSDNSIVEYPSGNRPVLIEQPGMLRVSSNQTVRGWFVFEVSRNLTPATLLIKTGDEDPIFKLDLPK